MRSEHARILCCPRCRVDFEWTVLREKAGDIEEAILRCPRCGAIYPLTDGIPRILPNALTADPRFCRDRAAELARMGFTPDRAQIRRFERAHAKTARAFGFEWNTYEVTTPEEDVVTLAALTGLDPAFYRKVVFADIFSHRPRPDDVASVDTSSLAGRTVLEMGCGMGKYVQAVAPHCALAVGLDLSPALARARRNTRHLANVLLVQGDILTPPFRPGAFDFVFSVGALHHTPDCRSAFGQCAALVKPGGRLSVWLYPTERRTGLYARAVHFVQDELMRPITCRLPPRWLYQLCRLLGRMTFWRDAAVARGRMRVAHLLALVAVGSHPEPKMAEFLNFDWYSPQYRSYHSEEELLRWFAEEGFAGITILPMRTSAFASRPLPGETRPLHPEPALHGCVDHPGENEQLIRGDDLVVRGWAFDVSGHSPTVEVFIDGHKVTALQCDGARVDVKRAYPNVLHALYCGWHGTVRVRRSWGRCVALKVTARSDACPPVVLAQLKLRTERRSAAS